jgi:hypothetical protein
MLIEWYSPYFINHLLVCPEGPGKHEEKKQTENDERTQPVDADTTYLFQIVNEFHVNDFFTLLF